MSRTKRIWWPIALGLLVALNAGPVQELSEECARQAEYCDNLAKCAEWRRKALFGMMHPDYMAAVMADIEATKDGHGPDNMLAALAFWDYEPYFDALGGDFSEHTSIRAEEPFAVFSDEKGDGLVMYKSGFGYRVGSKIKGGYITRITPEFMTITKAYGEQEEEIVYFEGLYLAGRLVDEKGIGFDKLSPLTEDRLIKGWKKD